MTSAMPLRADLLELTPQALTALANAGFVKRAQKEAAAGQLPALAQEADGSVVARFDDGVCTRLPPDRTLRDASCSCPASGMCRHRVMLVLAYQAQAQASGAGAGAASADPAPAISQPGTAATPDALAVQGAWSPAQFDDAALAAAFAPGTLEQARRLAATGPVIGLQPWRGEDAPPVARLPMCSVRFFSRHALAHARCDCQQGSGCAHVVLAVWAFRAGGVLPVDAAETVVQLANPDAGEGTAAERQGPGRDDPAQALHTAVDALLRLLWLEGSSQLLAALAVQVEPVRAQAQALGWRWVDDALDELWQLLQAQHARSSRFDPLRLLQLQAELWARLRAAGDARRRSAAGERPARPASLILGEGVQGEVALDHLRLVSLGAQLWSDDQAEGASVLLADPDTQTVTVLERRWPRAEDAAAGGTATPLASRRVAGLPLRQLAAGQIVTKAARRRANGWIDIGAGTRQTSVLPLSPTAWDALAPPLLQRSVVDLAEHLRTQPPDFVLPRLAATGAGGGAQGAVHVLAFAGMAVRARCWDAAAQVLHARIGGQPGAAEDAADVPTLALALPHRAAAPHAVDTLARALAGQWGPLRAVAGPVSLCGGQARMQPLAVLTEQRAVVLQLEGTTAQPLPLGTGAPHLAPLQALVEDAGMLLATWLRQGLRHQTGDVTARLGAQAERLQSAGLVRCAALMGKLALLLRGAPSGDLVAALSTLTLLLQGVAQAADEAG